MTNLEHLSTETLADYAEGLLRESEASTVAAHLDGCAECRAEEQLLVSLSALLAADSPGPMPAAYAARIDAALAEVAMTDPISGSFRPEGSSFSGAALDLTPSAFTSASATGGDGPPADVIDLSSRRRGVAQGLSRVTTVAASIVLLIGGTVLGLQAINSGDTAGPGDPSVAEQPGKPIAQRSTQPAPISKATAVPIDPDAKKNADGSFTNKDGTVILPDGAAVMPDGKFLPAPAQPKYRPGKGEDPAIVNPPDGNPGTAGKADPDRVSTAQAPAGPQIPPRPGPTPVAENPTVVDPGPAPEAAPSEAAAVPDATVPPAAEPDAVASSDPDAQKSQVTTADAETRSVPSGKPYFDQSGDTYDKNNFAKKVLDLLNRGYQASSTGDPALDPEPAAEPDPTVSPSSPSTFTPASIAIAMPTGAESLAAPDSAAAARPGFEARAKRCASFFAGQLLAADGGMWEGKAATIIVTTDPKDPNQVIGRVIYGGCKDRAATLANEQHTQYVVTRTPDA